MKSIAEQITGINTNFLGKVVIVFITLMIFVPSVWAATYYVDFAGGSDGNNGISKSSPWQRAPGMRGFTGSYTHQAGDQFIFKGGVTWDNTVAPWTISNSGTSGNNDYYGVDKTWFSGPSWGRPILDGGSQNPVATDESLGYWIISGSYITLDNITLQNIGVAGINQGNYALKLASNHDILIENMNLAVQSRIAIAFSIAATNVNLSNFEIKNNDISECSWGIGGGPSTGTVVTNVLIHNNTFHDFHSQIADGAHGDGIYFFTAGDQNSYMDGVRIYNNYFYGDFSKADTSATGMSTFIWAGAQTKGTAYIYNNVMTYTQNGGGVSSAISAGGASTQGTVYVMNNSFDADQYSYYFVSGQDLGNLIVENNVSTGGAAYEVLQSPLSSLVTDYNDFYGSSSGFAFNLSYAQFKASGPIASISVKSPGSGYTVGSVIAPKYGIGALATVTSVNDTGGVTGLDLTAGGYGFIPGYPGIVALESGAGSGLTVNVTVPVSSGFETNGISSNPLFVSSSDLQLETGSPVIGAGTNLSSLCTSTLAGAALCSDQNGNPRPASGNWSMGAFVYQTTLSVSMAGNGYGEVFSSDGIINCGVNPVPPPDVCTDNVNVGTAVTLTATPATGSVFSGWSGVCSGTGTCTVTVNSAQSVTANFSSGLVNGSCGAASQTYLYQSTSFGGNPLCKAGTPNPAAVSFPVPGGMSTWTCVGANGGLNSTCKAKRNPRTIVKLL